MKNLIYIDVDTDREQQIKIGKGPEMIQPQNKDEASSMIKNDIGCVCEALCSLIHVAHESGYGTKEQFVLEAIKQLNTLLVESNEK